MVTEPEQAGKGICALVDRQEQAILLGAESSSLRKPSHEAHASFPWQELGVELLEYSRHLVPSIQRKKIKDAPKRTEIPGALLCGSAKVAAEAGPS